MLTSYVKSCVHRRFDISLTENQLNICMSSIVSIFLLAGATGSLTASYLADRFGRKRALIIGNILGILGGLCFLIIKWTDAIELFFLGRILVGKIIL